MSSKGCAGWICFFSGIFLALSVRDSGHESGHDSGSVGPANSVSPAIPLWANPHVRFILRLESKHPVAVQFQRKPATLAFYDMEDGNVHPQLNVGGKLIPYDLSKNMYTWGQKHWIHVQLQDTNENRAMSSKIFKSLAALRSSRKNTVKLESLSAKEKSIHAPVNKEVLKIEEYALTSGHMTEMYAKVLYGDKIYQVRKENLVENLPESWQVTLLDRSDTAAPQRSINEGIEGYLMNTLPATNYDLQKPDEAALTLLSRDDSARYHVVEHFGIEYSVEARYVFHILDLKKAFNLQNKVYLIRHPKGSSGENKWVDVGKAVVKVGQTKVKVGNTKQWFPVVLYQDPGQSRFAYTVKEENLGTHRRGTSVILKNNFLDSTAIPVFTKTIVPNTEQGTLLRHLNDQYAIIQLGIYRYCVDRNYLYRD